MIQKLICALLILFFSSAALALSADVKGFPKNYEFKTSQRCFAPFFCMKKGSSDVATYEDKVWGNPKFWPGSITFKNAEKLTGKLAVFTTPRDWKFVKRFALFIPEGEATAYYVAAGDALLMTQKTKKKELVFDVYGDGYLERLVTGKLRLSLIHI